MPRFFPHDEEVWERSEEEDEGLEGGGGRVFTHKVYLHEPQII